MSSTCTDAQTAGAKMPGGETRATIPQRKSIQLPVGQGASSGNSSDATGTAAAGGAAGGDAVAVPLLPTAAGRAGPSVRSPATCPAPQEAEPDDEESDVAAGTAVPPSLPAAAAAPSEGHQQHPQNHARRHHNHRHQHASGSARPHPHQHAARAAAAVAAAAAGCGGSAAAAAPGGGGGLRLRPFRSVPAAALAAAAEAYLRVLSRAYSGAEDALLEPLPSPRSPPPPPEQPPVRDPVRDGAERGSGVEPMRAALRDSEEAAAEVASGLRSPPQGPATPTAATTANVAAGAAANTAASATGLMKASSLPAPIRGLGGGTLFDSSGDVGGADGESDGGPGDHELRTAASGVSGTSSDSSTGGSWSEAANCDMYGSLSSSRSSSMSSALSALSAVSSGTSSDDDREDGSRAVQGTTRGDRSCCVERQPSTSTSTGGVAIRASSSAAAKTEICDGGGDNGTSCALVSSAPNGGTSGCKRTHLVVDASTQKGVLSSTTDLLGRRAAAAPKPQLAVLTPQEPRVPRPPPGVRHYPDGRTASYKQSLPLRLLAQATLLAYVGWPYLLLAVAVAALRGSLAAVVAAAALAATLLLPAPPDPSEAFLNSWLFRLWRGYFNFSVLYEEMLDLTRPHIFVTSPHGAFPLSQILGGSLGGTLWPGHPIHCLAASCLFYVPLWRHIKAWMGAAPATRATAKKLLTTRGSVAVLAGGIAEMYEQGLHGNRCERVKLLGRRGFVRLALEMGVPIVPVYHFGNSQVLSFGPLALQPLCRRLRMAIGTIIGLWGLPIPRPQPLFMCIGRPIHVPPDADPRDGPAFEALVDETLRRVVESYKDLYRRYGPEYGWADRPLEVC